MIMWFLVPVWKRAARKKAPFYMWQLCKLSEHRRDSLRAQVAEGEQECWRKADTWANSAGRVPKSSPATMQGDRTGPGHDSYPSWDSSHTCGAPSILPPSSTQCPGHPHSSANDTDGSHSAATCCPAVLHGPLRMAFSHRDLERQLQSGSKTIRKSVTLLHKPSAIPTQVGCYNLFTCHRKASALL